MSGRSKRPRIHNLRHLKKYRRRLRNNLTPAEAKLWKLLGKRRLAGRKFRRQHSVGRFILDFYCPSEKLAIELDGQRHFDDLVRQRDFERTVYLRQKGIRVLRFENRLVFEETEWVLGAIRSNFGWHRRNKC